MYSSAEKKINLNFCPKQFYKYDRRTCHICHRNGIWMGAGSMKRLYRHWKFQHGITDPKPEETEENLEIINKFEHFLFLFYLIQNHQQCDRKSQYGSGNSN